VYSLAVISAALQVFCSGTENNCLRSSEDVVGITPPFRTFMPANANSNSLILSFDFTPPEITDVCDAVLMEITTNEDTDGVVELDEIDEGLRRPYNCIMVDAVNLLTWSGKQTEEQVDALVKIVKMQQRAKKG
jgi:hypothetical protein